MPKLVNSAAYRVAQLEHENAELKAKLAEVTAKRDSLRAASIGRPRRQVSDTLDPSAALQRRHLSCRPITTCEGFMKTTRASRARHVEAQQSTRSESSPEVEGDQANLSSSRTTVDNIPCYYHDGILLPTNVVPAGLRWQPSYMRDTVSSEIRLWQKRTKAQDQVLVPAAYEFAKHALELAKESLHEYTKLRHPFLCARLSQHGPTLIATVRAELERATDDFNLAYEIGIAHEPADLVDLRNFVAHPNWRCEALSTYDRQVQNAKALMIKMGDESQIKDREAVALLDGADVHGDGDGDGVWQSQHIKLFRRLLKCSEGWRRDPDNLDPAVRRVAELWGEMNPLGAVENDTRRWLGLEVKDWA
ncbi:hypothetical protein N658DRAFT_504635 [Parathielavia hyrcaniae]|uniref:Uncharacterized protein n=1 Tax=Parathielavia hyrcaniae TaxID=113614 RepID=A0AAN6T545_9PEZI|nr:hypothetical protein N658DRAFT_504635 [Parathielavia hyrcaniae]